MTRLDAFEMLEQLDPSERPLLILITSNDQYAVRAFEAGVVDYLLKPVTNHRLSLALERAVRATARSHTGYLTQQVEQLLDYVRRIDGDRTPPEVRGKSPASVEQLVVKAEGALHFIKTDEIIFIEAQGDFVKVQTSTKVQLVRETLQALEQRLNPSHFLRIHRSFVVNIRHVSRVETALYGDHAVHMSDGTKLRLSRTYRGKLKALL
jgi:two-component system LytT family response regulator